MVKTFIATTLGKSIFFLSRLLKLGGGFAAPGLYGLKIDQDLVEKLINHRAQNIVITGTNGKTTTSKLISHFLKSSGFKVLHNGSGSNLERGIASYLISHSKIFGKLDYDFGVWELDEFAFNSVAPKIRPDMVILLNAFRDQLDRYGEVDKVISRWKTTLALLSPDTRLVLNQDDANLLKATEDFKGKIITIGVKNQKILGEAQVAAIKKPDYQAEILGKPGFESNKIKINSQAFTLPLPGIFNVYNFLASFTSLYLFNIDVAKIRDSLGDFKPAFGRFEKFKAQEKQGFIFLIKNPVGATETFKTVLPNISDRDSLLVALNDNFADGTDVSWIWDIKLEELKIPNSKFQILISGTRAFDLALRLKYAGVTDMVIEENLEAAFDKAVETSKGKIFILPTYTALLSLQKILVSKGIKKEYWREK